MTRDSPPASAPPNPPVDDKDWTWVLSRPCPECGFDAATATRAQLPELIRGSTRQLQAALAAPDAARRPSPLVWSPLEYGCHCRDVCLTFDGRLQLLLTEDDPLFANWDQDETALAERYWEQDPARVSAELRAAAETIATRFATVSAAQWERPGRRSNGSVFTVHTLGWYFVHDLVHHAHDVG
jgi:DinB superfamily